MDLGFFNKYPYTDFHELNLDWIINALKAYASELEEFVQINAIKYADPIQWDIMRQYEKNTVVIDPLTGTAYISVQAVPAGVSISRTDYWSVIFDLSRFITAANNNFTVRVETAPTTTATFNTAAGEWLIWDQKLYKANVNITAGDAYVEGSNITRWTVEEGLQQINTALAALTADVGDLNDLTTYDKSSIVNAINDVVTALTTVVNNVGDLASLTTVDQSSIVNAINELVTNLGTLSGNVGNLASLTTVDQSSIVNAINELVTNLGTLSGSLTALAGDVGNLASLTTVDQSSIVNAINELVTNIGIVSGNLITLTGNVGDLADLNTTDKSSIVNAINEVLGNIPSGSDFVTPEQFGAVGDGVTDDTQAVIDAANYAASNNKSLYLGADYATDSTCITEGLEYILLAGHISNLWIRNAYGGTYYLRGVDDLKITSVKNATFILGDITELSLIADESLNTMINAGIGYNTFVGGYAATVNMTSSTANEWTSENKFFGTRIAEVNITGGINSANNNVFECVNLESGSVTLVNARSNHFRLRGEGGYTLTADQDSYNNTFAKTYAVSSPLGFALEAETSENGNLRGSDILYRYTPHRIFDIDNTNCWHNDNDYSTGQFKPVAWTAIASRLITPENDCAFVIASDVAAFRPHFRLYKNGSVVLTRSSAVYGSSLSFNTSTGWYTISSNINSYKFAIIKSTDFDQIEIEAYPSVNTMVKEFYCDMYTIGKYTVTPLPAVMLRSATKPTNASAPLGLRVADSTGATAGWVKVSGGWAVIDSTL